MSTLQNNERSSAFLDESMVALRLAINDVKTVSAERIVEAVKAVGLAARSVFSECMALDINGKNPDTSGIKTVLSEAWEMIPGDQRVALGNHQHIPGYIERLS